MAQMKDKTMIQRRLGAVSESPWGSLRGRFPRWFAAWFPGWISGRFYGWCSGRFVRRPEGRLRRWFSTRLPVLPRPWLPPQPAASLSGWLAAQPAEQPAELPAGLLAGLSAGRLPGLRARRWRSVQRCRRCAACRAVPRLGVRERISRLSGKAAAMLPHSKELRSRSAVRAPLLPIRKRWLPDATETLRPGRPGRWQGRIRVRQCQSVVVHSHFWFLDS